MFCFKNTYSNLPEDFYQRVLPEAHLKPELLIFNDELANRLNLDLDTYNDEDKANFLTGKKLSETSNSIALAYAGHQFGHLVPQLGDGRAVLLGELPIGDKLYDIQLKGSGRTRFSRRGDGRSSLGPAIREYLVSLYMRHINIPTTESLSVCLSGEHVQREVIHPGAVVARVAKAHIRIGTFEYFYYKKDFKNLKVLADYSISRLYPNINDDKDKYFTFFQEVSKRQLSLIAKWMSVGFIHGVMNTDNTSISGETIDFGPCAFMDIYESEKVFSSIDKYKRYSYNNQKNIIMWNLSSLANCLAALAPNVDDAIDSYEEQLEKLPSLFETYWLKEMSKKFGIHTPTQDDKILINDFLVYLEENKRDFTISFRDLPNQLDSSIEVYNRIKKRLDAQGSDLTKAIELMNKNNPEMIARNHHIEEAIFKSYQGDHSLVNKLASAYASPYKVEKANLDLKAPPNEAQVVQRTFCGT